MQFNSINFMIFFPIVIAVYFIIPRKLRSIWLLLASYYFYMSWNAKYALLIGFSTIVTYFTARAIEGVDNNDKRLRKEILIAGIVINLAILIIFKYADFAIDTVDAVMNRIGLTGIDYRLNLLLPVGISFYTFQAIGYVIDVYRGETVAETNIIRYALFVSFFPQLVAGPIERSKNLLGQLRKIEEIDLFNAKRVTSGAILMIWGLFLKMVISDRIAILVDNVFDNYRMQGGTALILAAIGFSIQIYCDFNSYSTVAIGAARVMGFSLMENFNSPYFANSIRDFWGRWHISLSTWFRDYLYIPLGGNRKGKLRKHINRMIVFLVSGLWHGANFTFIVWGGIHGLYQTIGELLRPIRDRVNDRIQVNTTCFSYRFGQIIVTDILAVFAWIFFRADTLTDAMRFIKRIFTRFDPWQLFNGGIFELGLDRIEMNILVVALLVLLAVDLMKYLKGKTIDAFLMEQNLWFEWIVIILFILALFIFGEYGPAFDAKQFIYFQF